MLAINTIINILYCVQISKLTCKYSQYFSKRGKYKYSTFFWTIFGSLSALNAFVTIPAFMFNDSRKMIYWSIYLSDLYMAFPQTCIASKALYKYNLHIIKIFTDKYLINSHNICWIDMFWGVFWMTLTFLHPLHCEAVNSMILVQHIWLNCCILVRDCTMVLEVFLWYLTLNSF